MFAPKNESESEKETRKIPPHYSSPGHSFRGLEEQLYVLSLTLSLSLSLNEWNFEFENNPPFFATHIPGVQGRRGSFGVHLQKAINPPERAPPTSGFPPNESNSRQLLSGGFVEVRTGMCNSL